MRMHDTISLPRLQGDKNNFAARKEENLYLADLYETLNLPDYALRARLCATELTYGVVNGERRLVGAPFCYLRLCPLCSARRSRKITIKLSRMLDVVAATGDSQYIFLTLTVRNVDGAALGATLAAMTAAWHRLMCQRPVARVVKGWYRAIEVTNTGRGYHPHIHAILSVPRNYAHKGGPYVSQPEWTSRWKQALGVDYTPVVYIEATRARNGDRATLAAAKEAAKYAVKSADYIGLTLSEEEAARRVWDYTRALAGRRLIGFGGTLRTAARMLGVADMETNANLTDEDDLTIRRDVYDMIETYRWHWGVHDYVLDRVLIMGGGDKGDNRGDAGQGGGDTG